MRLWPRKQTYSIEDDLPFLYFHRAIIRRIPSNTFFFAARGWRPFGLVILSASRSAILQFLPLMLGCQMLVGQRLGTLRTRPNFSPRLLSPVGTFRNQDAKPSLNNTPTFFRHHSCDIFRMGVGDFLFQGRCSGQSSRQIASLVSSPLHSIKVNMDAFWVRANQVRMCGLLFGTVADGVWRCSQSRWLFQVSSQWKLQQSIRLSFSTYRNFLDIVVESDSKHVVSFLKHGLESCDREIFPILSRVLQIGKTFQSCYWY